MSATAVSLFSGVGGLDLGLARAGIRPVLLCEFDPWKRSVLAAHHPGVPIHDDVRTLADLLGAPEGSPEASDADRDPVLRSLRQHDRPVDVLHGGFPCQDVSVAGKRAGLAGGRTGLFFEALRVVDAIRPRAVLLENVPGLLSSNGGRDFGVVLGELAERGYGVAWRVLDAQHFGVPQRRRRVFVLALAGSDPRACGERAAAVLAIGESVRGHLAPSDAAGADAASRVAGGARGGRVADTLTSGSHPNSNRPGRRREDDTNLVPTVAQTLTAERGQRIRRLTPRECERLMGWPDDYTAPPGVNAPDSRRYAACGDGVVANVAEWIGRRLVAAISTSERTR